MRMEMWFINLIKRNMTDDYIVAIPSYKRASTLKNKTLSLLEKYNIPKEKINIFVADGEEAVEYGKVLPEYRDNIIIGQPTLKGARHFIRDYFEESQWILNMDDDIEKIDVRENEYYTKELEDLDGFILKGVETARKLKINLWGVYPLINAGFMYAKLSTDLRYIVGAFWGLVNTHNKNTYTTMEDKEDYERTIKFYIKDGKVLRFNHVGIKTAYYTEAGGMQVTRTKERVRESGMELIQRYPMFCEYNKARDRHFEIRLVDKTKRNVKNRKV
jgi:hypothetical protein